MTIATKRKILGVFFFASISLASWRIVEAFKGTFVAEKKEDFYSEESFEFVDEEIAVRFVYAHAWDGLERINIPAYDDEAQQHINTILYAALIEGKSNTGFFVAYGDGHPAPREAYWFDQIAMLVSPESIESWCDGKTSCVWHMNEQNRLYLHAFTEESVEFGESYADVNEYVFFRSAERYYFDRILVSDQHLRDEQKEYVPQLVNSLTW